MGILAGQLHRPPAGGQVAARIHHPADPGGGQGIQNLRAIFVKALGIVVSMGFKQHKIKSSMGMIYLGIAQTFASEPSHSSKIPAGATRRQV